MAFCSNKINDFLLKFDSLGINVNENTKKVREVEYKFAKILNKADILKSNYNTTELVKLATNLDIIRTYLNQLMNHYLKLP